MHPMRYPIEGRRLGGPRLFLLALGFCAAVITAAIGLGCHDRDRDRTGPLPTVDDCLTPEPTPSPIDPVSCLDFSGLSSPRTFPYYGTVGNTACLKGICYLEVGDPPTPQCYYRCPPRRCS
jgi:hypothetical protein